MELHAIGIDLGKTVFTWLASIRAERSSFAKGVLVHNYWRTRPMYAFT